MQQDPTSHQDKMTCYLTDHLLQPQAQYRNGKEIFNKRKLLIQRDIASSFKSTSVAEPPRLYGPHAQVIVSHTSDSFARVPHNPKVVSGVPINPIAPRLLACPQNPTPRSLACWLLGGRKGTRPRFQGWCIILWRFGSPPEVPDGVPFFFLASRSKSI